MSEQPQQQQSDGKAVAIYLIIWLVVMCVLCAPPEVSTGKVLWDLFAGGVLLVELVLVGGWILKKIL